MKKILSSVAIALIGFTSLRAQVILQDDFNYADGLTPTVSGGLWSVHSPTTPANNSFVNTGRLEIVGSRADDINRPFAGTPGNIVYASFVVRQLSLPSAGGAYFAHFKDSGTSNFRARTWAFAPAGTTPGCWRLGITAAGNAPIAMFPLDLATNVDYRVVIAYDGDNFLGTLWVDPVSESDQNSLTSDSTTALTLTSFAFRQATGEGSLTVDDFFAGNSFADVNVGGVKAATIYTQPIPALVVDNFAATNFYCVAGGAGTVTFQWQKQNGAVFHDIVDGSVQGATSNRLAILAASSSDAGVYRCVVTSTTNGVFASSVVSTEVAVAVNTVPVPPFVTSQPANRTNTLGSTTAFTVGAGGSSPLSFQWYHILNSVTNPVGTGEATLTLNAIDSTVEGQYYAEITNPYGTTNSALARLVVIPPIATNIAYLRTLQNANWLPSDTNTTFQAEGIVTVRTNTTGLANVQFYMQDQTAGIVVFFGGLSGATSQPQAGDKVRVVGRLGSFNSLLEFNNTVNNPHHSLTVLSSGNPMPPSAPFAFSLTNNLPAIEALEGSLITITNAYFVTGGAGANFPRGGSVVITNSNGEPFSMFVNGTALTETNVPIPAFAYEVTGVLGQFLSESAPERNGGYQIIPTSYAYVVTNLPPSPDLSVARAGNVTTLQWPNLDGSTYSIHAASAVAGPYNRIAFGLNFLGAGSGNFTETNISSVRFYRATSP